VTRTNATKSPMTARSDGDWARSAATLALVSAWAVTTASRRSTKLWMSCVNEDTVCVAPPNVSTVLAFG